RAERPLVGGELDDALEAELALQLLDRLAGLVGDELGDCGCEEALGQDGHYCSGPPPSSWSPDRLRKNTSTPLAAAIRSAIADLFGRSVSSTVPGTASFAFFFATRLPALTTTQPTTAFRLLTMLICGSFPRGPR